VIGVREHSFSRRSEQRIPQRTGVCVNHSTIQVKLAYAHKKSLVLSSVYAWRCKARSSAKADWNRSHGRRAHEGLGPEENTGERPPLRNSSIHFDSYVEISRPYLVWLHRTNITRLVHQCRSEFQMEQCGGSGSRLMTAHFHWLTDRPMESPYWLMSFCWLLFVDFSKAYDRLGMVRGRRLPAVGTQSFFSLKLMNPSVYPFAGRRPEDMREHW